MPRMQHSRESEEHSVMAIYTCLKRIQELELADRRAERQTQQIGHKRRTKTN